MSVFRGSRCCVEQKGKLDESDSISGWLRYFFLLTIFNLIPYPPNEKKKESLVSLMRPFLPGNIGDTSQLMNIGKYAIYSGLLKFE